MSFDDWADVIFDTGSSMSFNFGTNNFLVPVIDTSLNSFAGFSVKYEVKGEGEVQWTVRDQYGCIISIRTTPYCVTTERVRLLRPQKYSNKVKLVIPDLIKMVSC